MARLIVVFALVAGLMTAAFGAASTMTVNGIPTIQVGEVGTQCQTNPLTVTNNFKLPDVGFPYGSVTSINISGVDAACNGANIFVQAYDTAGNQISTLGYDWNNGEGNLAVINGSGPYKIYFGNKGDGTGAPAADALGKYVIWFSNK